MRLDETPHFTFIFSLDGKIMQSPVDAFDATSQLFSASSRYWQPRFPFWGQALQTDFYAGTFTD